jgi:hypothetical protein
MARYLIFARTRYEDPLSLEGDLEAQDDDAAADAARRQVGEGCVELQLVPAEAIRWVVGPAGRERAQRQEVARA